MKSIISLSSLVATLLFHGCGTTTDTTANSSHNNKVNDAFGKINRGVSQLFGYVENFRVDGQIMTHALSPNGKYLYATTLNPIKIHVFKRDTQTGKLTQIQSLSKTDFVEGKDPFFNPLGITVSPDGKQLYISAAFGINRDDELPFGYHLLKFTIDDSGYIHYSGSTLSGNHSATITKNGQYIFTDNSDGAKISVINRANNGDTSLNSTISQGLQRGNMTFLVSPDDHYLYAASDLGDLYNFAIEPEYGGLTSNYNLTKSLGAGGTGMAISKDGKFFYSVGGYGTAHDSIRIFNRNNDGSLSFFKNVPAPLVNSQSSNKILYSSNSHLILNPNQHYIYTFDPIMGTLGIWKRNLNLGNLSYIGKYADLSAHLSGSKLEIAPDEKHLYLNIKSGFISYDLRADVDVQETISEKTLKPFQNFNYNITVQNHGPSNADDVIVTTTLPDGVDYIGSSTDKKSSDCEISGQTVTCHMGTLFTSALYHIKIDVKAPEHEGSFDSQTNIVANQLDTNQHNNQSIVTTTIVKN